MKNIQLFYLLFISIHSICAVTYVDPLTPTKSMPVGTFIDKKWKLDFSDEFNGSTVNTDKWNVENISKSRSPVRSINVASWFWKAENTTVKEGNLILTAIKQADSTLYAGAINSDKKYMSKYGYYEVCAKVADTQKGVTTAYWFMGNNVKNVDGTGNDGAEIDVFETAWLGDKTHANIHYDGYGADHKKSPIDYMAPNLTKGYHTWGLWWTDSFLRVYYDGIMTAEYTDAKLIPWVEERIILSTAPAWGLKGNQFFTDFPKGILTQAYIDYIRIWKQQ